MWLGDSGHASVNWPALASSPRHSWKSLRILNIADPGIATGIYRAWEEIQVFSMGDLPYRGSCQRWAGFSDKPVCHYSSRRNLLGYLGYGMEY